MINDGYSMVDGGDDGFSSLLKARVHLVERSSPERHCPTLRTP